MHQIQEEHQEVLVMQVVLPFQREITEVMVYVAQLHQDKVLEVVVEQLPLVLMELQVVVEMEVQEHLIIFVVLVIHMQAVEVVVLNQDQHQQEVEAQVEEEMV